MGWANCGTDSNGRPIGYAHPATCDHTGCEAEVDRGLSYACGGMHGEDEVSCERYFCDEHRAVTVLHCDRYHRICSSCAKELLDSGEWVDDENEGILRHDLEGGN